MKKNWVLAPTIDEELQNQFPEINPIILQLLYNRGLKGQEQIDEFLLPDYSQDLHDPFLFTDMEKVVERIYRAIKNKEKILVYGDYDADGISAATILKLTLDKLGAEKLDIYLPDREKEGYGMKTEVIQKIAQDGVKLIITCDNGITANQEVDLANQLGMEVIITDHHLPLKIVPAAYAIINPKCEEKYPFKGLSGAAVAFKLIQALLQNQVMAKFGVSVNNPEAMEKWMLDLVAISIVADSMPLVGENRTLVKYGLVVLNKTSRPGLRALIQEAKVELGALDTSNISFQIAPRLNAASRIDHANTALELVLTESTEEAKKMAQELNRINSQRQKIIDEIFQEIKNYYGPEPKDKILIAMGEKWPVGVLGLIASKLMEEYDRPALAIKIGEDNIIGSGRSRNGFNLVELYSAAQKFLSRFGGHSEAAGFAIANKEMVAGFVQEVHKIAEEKLRDIDFTKRIFVEAEIKLTDVNWGLEEALEGFAPFGEGNQRPLFLIRDLKVDNLQRVGQKNQHLKIFANGHKFIFFGANSKFDHLRLGDKIDLIIEIGVNQWNGTKELQMKAADIKIYE